MSNIVPESIEVLRGMTAKCDYLRLPDGVNLPVGSTLFNPVMFDMAVTTSPRRADGTCLIDRGASGTTPMPWRRKQSLLIMTPSWSPEQSPGGLYA